MLTVHGRILSAPRVGYRQVAIQSDQESVLSEPKVQYATVKPNYAEWNLMGVNFFKQATMTKWSYLCLGRANIPITAFEQFKIALQGCGMVYKGPEPDGGYRAELPETGDDDKNDEEIKKQMALAAKDEVPILLVVLNTATPAVYARVKYWGDTTYGMFSILLHILYRPS